MICIMTHTLCLSTTLTLLLIVGSSASLPPHPISTGTTSLPTVLPTPWKPWIVRNDTNSVCILAKFGAEFVMNPNSKSGESLSPYVLNPLNAQVSNESHCGHDLQVLRLVFNQNLSLSFSFMRDIDSIFVSQIVFNITEEESVVYPTDDKTLFRTPKDFGYKCFEAQTIPLNDRINMTLMNIRLEAFKLRDFNETEDNPEQWERVGLKCSLDRKSGDAWKITGISVGCGIFVLTFITLVAVWSGRKQERVMLKVKMMRQWTIEEAKAFEARGMAVNKGKADNKNGPKQSSNTLKPVESVKSISNPTYNDSNSEKF